MRIKAATIAAAILLAAFLANHWCVHALVARISPPGRPPADFGVELPGYLKFLVKLDHFAVDYGYVLIPFAWVLAFLVATIWANLRDFFVRRKAEWVPESWPGDP
jgi:hypothetical protein